MRYPEIMLWMRPGETCYRVWIVPLRSTERVQGPGETTIHFASLDWTEVGSLGIAPGTHLVDLSEQQLCELLQRATGGPREIEAPAAH